MSATFGRSAPAASAFVRCSGGTRQATTTLEAIRNVDMITAAVISSLRVLAIRPRGSFGSSSSSPLTSGMTATPVSNPDRPRASFGKMIRLMATTVSSPPPESGASRRYHRPASTWSRNAWNFPGCSTRYTTPAPTTTVLSTR